MVSQIRSRSPSLRTSHASDSRVTALVEPAGLASQPLCVASGAIRLASNAFLILQAIETLHLRMHRINQNTLAVALTCSSTRRWPG